MTNNNPCVPNHVWTYAQTNTKGKIPAGLQCHCGRMIAHYDLCGECGAEKFEPIDTKASREDD